MTKETPEPAPNILPRCPNKVPFHAQRTTHSRYHNTRPYQAPATTVESEIPAVSVYRRMDSPYALELAVALGAVQDAAKLSKIVLADHDKGTIKKDDLSPVTVGDFAIQALLTATFHHAFPADKFIGEESADELRGNPELLNRVYELAERVRADGESCPTTKAPESRGELLEMIDWCGHGMPGGADAGRVWVFDPIDGTKTFVRGEIYAINIALLEGGKPVLGVVGCPLLSKDATAPVFDNSIDPTGQGCILFAIKDHGTYVRRLFGLPLEVTPQRLERHADKVTTIQDLRSVSTLILETGISPIHRAVTEQLGVPFPGCDVFGSVPRCAVLALGLANLLVWVYKIRSHYSKIWDYAGSMLLFEEVGGKITDVDGKDIDFSAGRKLTNNFGYLAAPRAVHAMVLKKLQEVIREQGMGHLLATSTPT